MVQIGWKAGAEQFSPLELLAGAEQAEQAGFNLIDISDHFQPWNEAGQAVFARRVWPSLHLFRTKEQG